MRGGTANYPWLARESLTSAPGWTLYGNIADQAQSTDRRNV